VIKGDSAVEQLPRAVQDAADAFLIQQALARYARGIDRLDSELVRSVYWDDAEDRHLSFSGSADAFVAWVIPTLKERWSSSSHMLGQTAIQYQGSRAGVETYFISYHFRTVDGRQVSDSVAGRYVDLFEKRMGEWRILRRTVVLDWARTEHFDGTPDIGGARGCRSRADSSYSIF
jgi:hypothetical protein